MSPELLSLPLLLLAALGLLLLRRSGTAGRATVQGTHLAIEAIADGVVTFAGGRRRAVLAVGSLNFATLGEAKQREVVAGYAAALDSLTFPVQVLVRATPPDLTAYLAARDARAEREPNARLRRVARDRNAFVRRLAGGRMFIDRRFYLVVPADDQRSATLPRRWGSTDTAGAAGDNAPAARQLAARCDDLIRQLGRCGLAARRLDDAELAALYFACWCPDLAAIERLGRELRDGGLVVTRERAKLPAPPARRVA